MATKPTKPSTANQDTNGADARTASSAYTLFDRLKAEAGQLAAELADLEASIEAAQEDADAKSNAYQRIVGQGTGDLYLNTETRALSTAAHAAALHLEELAQRRAELTKRYAEVKESAFATESLGASAQAVQQAAAAVDAHRSRARHVEARSAALAEKLESVRAKIKDMTAATAQAMADGGEYQARAELSALYAEQGTIQEALGIAANTAGQINEDLHAARESLATAEQEFSYRRAVFLGIQADAAIAELLPIIAAARVAKRAAGLMQGGNVDRLIVHIPSDLIEQAREKLGDMMPA